MFCLLGAVPLKALEPVNPSLQQGLVKQANPGISEKCINGQRLFNTFPSVAMLIAASIACAPPDHIKLNSHVQEGLVYQSLQKDEQAYQAFKAAWKEGDLFGTALLGTAYLDGKGVQKNIARAETYFNEVLKNHEARKHTIWTEKQDYYAHRPVIFAAITARLGLAQIYESTNPKEALKMYERVPTSAQVYFLPVFFHTGIHLKSLNANDFEPYARELVGFALYKIGMAYKEGRGVKVELKKATEFLKKAVDFGNDKAIEALRSLQ
ncbi:tetratricopeptide repeat protein [Helicobacter suis]|uniref:tetratricopeptide repeat protein n=1 Tax=Helicobacter suis TaxID=104628 RepID=UPI0013D4A497|nr:SEL1-like repeat protein [Helicobacter suis]